MAIAMTVSESGRALILSGTLNAAAASLLCPDLIRQLRVWLPCEVDLSGLSQIDADGVKLLRALRRAGIFSHGGEFGVSPLPAVES